MHTHERERVREREREREKERKKEKREWERERDRDRDRDRGRGRERDWEGEGVLPIRLSFTSSNHVSNENQWRLNQSTWSTQGWKLRRLGRRIKLSCFLGISRAETVKKQKEITMLPFRCFLLANPTLHYFPVGRKWRVRSGSDRMLTCFKIYINSLGIQKLILATREYPTFASGSVFVVCGEGQQTDEMSGWWLGLEDLKSKRL